MISDNVVLAAIGSTEESDFGEFCRGLGSDCPQKGDKAEWSDLFQQLNRLEQTGFVTISRAGRNIDAMILTEQVYGYRGQQVTRLTLHSRLE